MKSEFIRSQAFYFVYDKIIKIYFDTFTSINVSVRINTSHIKECDRMGYREDVKMIKALADENRLAILKCLHSSEKCACVLLKELNITQSTLSHHMKILCDSGLVEYRKEGKWMHYSISLEGCQAMQEMLMKYIYAPSIKYYKCKSCE